jgi:hypothetical protein
MKIGELSHSGASRRCRLIPASRKHGAGWEGGEERHRSGRNWIGGVGEVGAHREQSSTMAFGRPEGNSVEGAVGGRWGRLLSREAVRHSRGAQDGGDEAEGGPTQADIVEVLGGGRRSLVGGERREGWHPVGS